MPVDWSFAEGRINLGGTGEYRIAESDAARQTVTARTVVHQLREQPGIVLADEVGMGKTYVALAVVASVLLSTRRSSDPVIVMVPPGLAGKWQREWQQFKANCTVGGALAWMNDRDRFAGSPTEFFKLLDDPHDRRARLIWLTTSCFAQGLGDGWVKLALVRLARRHTRMDDEAKARLYKWATALTQLRSKRGLTPEIVERLMTSDPLAWKRILVDHEVLPLGADDPVPAHLVRHADDARLDWRPLIDALRGVPGRRGQVGNERLRDARWEFNAECQALYWAWLRLAEWRTPLLVLDEAHHAKNDSTRLASLFRSADISSLIEKRDDSPPMFWRKADRMLFLTATPFQLGHNELTRVLRSFVAVRWTGETAPAKSPEQFLQALDVLESRLNENRLAGRRLDDLWGKLRAEHLGAANYGSDPLGAVAAWWASAASDDPLREELRRSVEECRRTKLRAERDTTEPWNGLHNWVIRHNRPTTLPRGPDDRDETARRAHRHGNAILETGEHAAPSGVGLPIAGGGALPFLLAARAQTELATSLGSARAYFAEGLSSSYEAFHHTRSARMDVSERDEIPSVEAGTEVDHTESIVPLEWYEEHVARLVPSSADPAACYAHPKLQAVVDRAIQLWLEAGEKVLIFCFYRETAKALRDHLRRRVDSAIARKAAERLGINPNHEDEAHEFLSRVGRRLADRDSPFNAQLTSLLAAEVDAQGLGVLAPWREQLIGALSAYVRSPAFVARYLPLDVPDVRAALQPGETRSEVIRHGTDALRQSFEEAVDGSGLTMRSRVRVFLGFARELALRSDVSTNDEAAHSPLGDYLDAVTIYVDRSSDEDEEPSVATTFRALPTVRMVYGGTKPEVRERVMLAFNSPLFPEILVSSSVLGEGVDLHRFCRHLIHHDLCWNPSTLEQRTGRLDRIHCKAEVARRSIVVYDPFLAGSADEKMFRVVRDRERWFQVVMGQKFELDERTTETLAARVPLPPSIAQELVFDLRRWHGPP